MEGTKGTWEALQPWSNIRVWSDASDASQPLDALVASVKETQEVVPLVERFRRPGTAGRSRENSGDREYGENYGEKLGKLR